MRSPQELKKYQSNIKKNKKTNDKLVLIRKAKLDNINALISKPLMDQYISHENFVLVNNMLRKYSEMKEETKNL